MTDIAAPNFDLNDEHRALLDDMTRSARAHFEADAMERDLSGQWPDDGFSRLAKMGVLGASVPETYGGAGLDLFSAGLVGQAPVGWIPPCRPPGKVTTIFASTISFRTAAKPNGGATYRASQTARLSAQSG